MANRFKRSSTNGARHVHARNGRVRIIAGQWRGRSISVVDVDGLRPTGDRTKEMLFNWLQTIVPGASCLDLFAGSGALGFEAASRYASDVVMVERDQKACKQIHHHIAEFDAGDQLKLEPISAEQFLDKNTQRFDLVFIDPPFQSDEYERILPAVEPHLATSAHVYLESAVGQRVSIPPEYRMLKEKVLGDVHARLFGYGEQNET